MFSSGGLAEGLPILSPTAAAAADDDQPPASDEQPAAVAELRLEAFPEAGSRGSGGSGSSSGSGGPEAVGAAPHLLARLKDGTLLAYRAFAPNQACRFSIF